MSQLALVGSVVGVVCSDALNLSEKLLKNNKCISKNIESQGNSRTCILLFYDISAQNRFIDRRYEGFLTTFVVDKSNQMSLTAYAGTALSSR